MTSSSISLSARPQGHGDSGSEFFFLKAFVTYTTIGFGGTGMGLFCRSRIYFIRYATIGHGGDGIGFICGGFYLVHDYWARR